MGHRPVSKAKIALEAICEEMTLAGLSKKTACIRRRAGRGNARRQRIRLQPLPAKVRVSSVSMPPTSTICVLGLASLVLSAVIHRPNQGLGRRYHKYPHTARLFVTRDIAAPHTDGKGAWRDNWMTERLWQSLKYDCVYLDALETGLEMPVAIDRWPTCYNS